MPAAFAADLWMAVTGTVIVVLGLTLMIGGM